MSAPTTSPSSSRSTTTTTLLLTLLLFVACATPLSPSSSSSLPLASLPLASSPSATSTSALVDAVDVADAHAVAGLPVHLPLVRRSPTLAAPGVSVKRGVLTRDGDVLREHEDDDALEQPSPPSLAAAAPTHNAVFLSHRLSSNYFEYWARLRFGASSWTNVQLDSGSSVLAVPLPACHCTETRADGSALQKEHDVSFWQEYHCTCGERRYRPTTADTLVPCSSSSSCTRGKCYRVEHWFGADAPTSGCEFEMEFGDRSYIAGPLMRDRVMIGNLTLPSVLFGGILEQSKGFYHDVVDGIWGIGPESDAMTCRPNCVRPTLLEQILRARALDDVFSLALDDDTGVLTIGGVPSDAHAHGANFSFVPMVRPSNFYRFDVVDIRVDNTSIAHYAGPRAGDNGGVDAAHLFAAGAIVDSGTSVNLLPPTWFAALRATFERHHAHLHGVVGSRSVWSGQTCLVQPPTDWPTITIAARTVNLTLEPHAYFLRMHDQGRLPAYCLGFAAVSEQRTRAHAVLGDVFMRNYVVVFDRARHRLGFAGSLAAARNAYDWAHRGIGDTAHIYYDIDHASRFLALPFLVAIVVGSLWTYFAFRKLENAARRTHGGGGGDSDDDDGDDDDGGGDDDDDDDDDNDNNNNRNYNTRGSSADSDVIELQVLA